MRSLLPWATLAELALLSAMTNAAEKARSRPRKYAEPIGPPHPKSRQHKRALFRQSEKALGKIS